MKEIELKASMGSCFAQGVKCRKTYGNNKCPIGPTKG